MISFLIRSGTRPVLRRETQRPLREPSPPCASTPRQSGPKSIQQTREYAETGGPHPERLHVIALTAKFLLEYSNLVAEWAWWAERHVERWPQTETIDGIHIPPDAFGPPLPWPQGDRPKLPARG